MVFVTHLYCCPRHHELRAAKAQQLIWHASGGTTTAVGAPYREPLCHPLLRLLLIVSVGSALASRPAAVPCQLIDTQEPTCYLETFAQKVI